MPVGISQSNSILLSLSPQPAIRKSIGFSSLSPSKSSTPIPPKILIKPYVSKGFLEAPVTIDVSSDSAIDVSCTDGSSEPSATGKGQKRSAKPPGTAYKRRRSSERIAAKKRAKMTTPGQKIKLDSI